MDLGALANIATTVAVIIGVVFGLAELRRSRRERRDQAALETVRQVQAQEIHEAVSRILKEPNDVDPGIINGNPELLRAAHLVHWASEMYGSMVFEGVIDLGTLDRINGGWIRACWLRLRRWVEAERAAERRVNVAEWWQWLYERLEEDPDPSKAVGAHVYYKGKSGP